MNITEEDIIKATLIALRAKKIAQHLEEAELIGIDPSKITPSKSKMFDKLKAGLDKKMKHIELMQKLEKHKVSYEEYMEVTKKVEETKRRRRDYGWE
jgi:hypothetical protein